MTAKDKDLIDRASRLHFTEWYLASKMAKESDTIKAQETLNDISKRLYHREEASCDLL